MAGTVVYVSFPRFTRKRQPSLSTMCRRIIEALLTLSGMNSCLSPRPGKTLKSCQASDSSQDRSQITAADGTAFTASPHAGNTPTARQQHTAPFRQTSFSEDHIPNPTNTPTRQSSSKYSSSTSSLSSVSGKLRAGVNRSISSWRSDHSDSWAVEGAEAVQSDTATTTSDEDLIAELDALALSQHERELLGRMQQVCHSARVARNRRFGRQEFESQWSQRWSGVDSVDGLEPGLRLRGGADDDEDVQPLRTARRRTTLPIDDPVLPKPDSARPHRVLWWLAGGRKGQVPTVGELRVRKEVEQANRKIVGFWGTVLGVRRVGRIGILPDSNGDDVGAEEERSPSVSGHADGILPQNRGSVHSIAHTGAGSGGSVVGSRRERELEDGHHVEAKAESVMSVASANNDPAHSKVGSVKDTAENQGKARSGSMMDAGAEDSKTEAESAKDVADGAARAETESMRSGEDAAEAVDENKARSSSND
jgi:hypothetical protein